MKDATLHSFSLTGLAGTMEHTSSHPRLRGPATAGTAQGLPSVRSVGALCRLAAVGLRGAGGCLRLRLCLGHEGHKGLDREQVSEVHLLPSQELAVQEICSSRACLLCGVLGPSAGLLLSGSGVLVAASGCGLALVMRGTKDWNMSIGPMTLTSRHSLNASGDLHTHNLASA